MRHELLEKWRVQGRTKKPGTVGTGLERSEYTWTNQVIEFAVPLGTDFMEAATLAREALLKGDPEGTQVQMGTLLKVMADGGGSETIHIFVKEESDGPK